jgi:hypothetical protein
MAAASSPQSGPASKHWHLLLILVTFALLCLLYSALVPLGETPDELAHYQYLIYLDRVGRPPLTAAERQQAGYKGHEPPLYYLLLQKPTAFLHLAQLPMLKLIDPDREPRHSIGSEAMLWDTVLHTSDESFPWQDTALAWHLLRALAIPFGMVTIVCSYAIARTLFPAQPVLAVAAAALNAFSPQFVYISAALNNDNLAVPLAGMSLWVLLRLARGNLQWRWFFALGVLVGLARITKFYALLWFPIIGLCFGLIAWRHRRWLRCLLGGCLSLALTMAISAPWLLFVQPDGAHAIPAGTLGMVIKMLDAVHFERALRSEGLMAAGNGLGVLPAMVLSFLHLDPQRWATLLFKSFWAYYGPMTLPAPSIVYWSFFTIVIICFLRFIFILLRRTVVRRPFPKPIDGLPWIILAIPPLAFVLMEALFYTMMRRLPDTAQGRHLYSAMPAWMAFLVAGLLGWLPVRAQHWGTGVLAMAFFALSVYLLPTVVLSAYEPPYPVRTTLPANWQPQVALQQEAAPGIFALGYSPALVSASAEGSARLAFTWRATAPIASEYLLRITLRDEAGTECLVYLAQPASGRWPTRAWDPGDYIRDEYVFAVPLGLSPGDYLLHAQWVTPELAPVGAPLKAGTLRVIESRDPPMDMPRLDGVSAGVARYRQAFTFTTLVPQNQSIPTMSMIDATGRAWLPLAMQTYRTNTGSVAVRGFFYVAGQTEPGRYAPSLDGRVLSLPFLVVRARARQFTVPAMGSGPSGYVRLDARLGGQITLCGYRLEGVRWPDRSRPEPDNRFPILTPGQTLDLRLVWRSESWISRNYVVFVHLLDEQHIIRAQHDQTPRFDYAPLFWVPTEVVEDVYHLSLPANAPIGVYQLEFGMYTRSDALRLPVRLQDSVAGVTVENDDRIVVPIMVKH